MFLLVSSNDTVKQKTFFIFEHSKNKLPHCGIRKANKMPYQNISASLTQADQTTILGALAQINALLTFIVNLTQEERQVMLKMGDKSEAFVNNSLTYAQQNPNLIPPYLNITEMQSDMALIGMLSPIFNTVKQLSEKLDDTVMALGSESFYAALTFYNTVKNAAKVNVPGTDAIYQDLKSRFPGAGTDDGTGDNPTP